MADNVRKVDYYYVMVPDAPGQGAKVLSGLAAEGVNLLAFSGFPSGRKGQAARWRSHRPQHRAGSRQSPSAAWPASSRSIGSASLADIHFGEVSVCGSSYPT